MDITRNPVNTTLSISSSARNCNGSSLAIPADPSWPKIPRRQLPHNYSGLIQQSTNYYSSPRKSRASLHHHSSTAWDAKSIDTTAQINASSASVSIADRLNHVLIRPQLTQKFTQQSREKRPAGCLDPRFYKQVTTKTSQTVTNELTSKSSSNQFEENRHQNGESSNDIVNSSKLSQSTIIPPAKTEEKKKIEPENSVQCTDSNYNFSEKNYKLPAVNTDVNIDGSSNDVEEKTNKPLLTQSINHEEACEKMLLDAVQTVNKAQASKISNRSISLTDLSTSSNNNFDDVWKDFKSYFECHIKSEQDIENNDTFKAMMFRNEGENLDISESHSRLLQRINQEKIDYHPADMTNDSSLIIPMKTQQLLNDSYLEYYNKLNSYQQIAAENNNRKSSESTSSTTTAIINKSNEFSKSNIRQTLDQCTALSSTMNVSVLKHQDFNPMTVDDTEPLFINNQVVESFSNSTADGGSIVDRKDFKLLESSDQAPLYVYRDDNDDDDSITSTETSSVQLTEQRESCSKSKSQINLMRLGIIISIFVLLIVIFHLMIELLKRPNLDGILKRNWIKLDIDDNNTNDYLDFLIDNYFVASFRAAFLQMYQLVNNVMQQSPVIELVCRKRNN
ncbi:hypothetical protein PV327_003837 [Microctonus hyperodae]|uniref:Uncharacterized protein n=1 Tax=Microctonus hyperodae TaxID=165561 RepID=A0AA39G6E6_MICHY|nr:hypothetical protein PV327_003837 [Microctonus hyperodae]